jgi:S-DNA-T family DNA segregation ATPase FtsK/SpoIIIE
VCDRRSALQTRPDLARLATPADAAAALADAGPDAHVLVDDVDLLDDPQLAVALEHALRDARDGRRMVVLAGTPDAMAAAYRGPVAEARRSRAGILLRPEAAHDGDVLGVRTRLRPMTGEPAGRGYLALHGQLTPLQVADPR